MSASDKKVGLALGGGAARGIAHIGVIKALHQYEIPIDAIAGTSAGSLVGGLYAAGLPIDTLVEQAKQLKWSDFASFHLSRMGMFSSRPIEQFVRKWIGNLTFQELKIPFAALATDLLTGEGVILNEPDLQLALAIKASASFPGVYEPTEINGRFLCDGGASGNVPSSVVREMGVDVVIAVDVIPTSQLDKMPKHVAAIVDRGLDLLLRQISKLHVNEANITLYPVQDPITSFHVKKGAYLIELGMQAVHQNIDAIRKIVS